MGQKIAIVIGMKGLEQYQCAVVVMVFNRSVSGKIYVWSEIAYAIDFLMHALVKRNPPPLQDIIVPYGVGLLTVLNNIYKIYSDIMPYMYVCMLKDNVPIGWGIFSVLAPVNLKNNLRGWLSYTLFLI